MPTDTEKLSDAELVALVTYVKDDLLLGRANEVTQNRFNRAAVQALEALARRLTARNDTIAGVTKVISFVGCDERITVEALAEAITKALIPTQPEASEPAAPALPKCIDCGAPKWTHRALAHEFNPAAPPDSPERCAFVYSNGTTCTWPESEHDLLIHSFKVQPPTAPPETRTATLKHARELAMAGLEHAESARAKAVEDEAREAEPETRDAARERLCEELYYWKLALSGGEGLVADAIAALIEARAAAAGGKRNE